MHYHLSVSGFLVEAKTPKFIAANYVFVIFFAIKITGRYFTMKLEMLQEGVGHCKRMLLICIKILVI